MRLRVLPVRAVTQTAAERAVCLLRFFVCQKRGEPLCRKKPYRLPLRSRLPAMRSAAACCAGTGSTNPVRTAWVHCWITLHSASRKARTIGLFPYFRAAAQTTRSSGAFFNVEDRYFPEERIASACSFRLKSARHHAIAIPPAIPRAARKVCSPKCSAADKSLETTAFMQ